MRRARRTDAMRRTGKYNARRTTVEGITFHSAKEARRWQELRLLEKAGQVRGIKTQPAFNLLAPNNAGAWGYVGCYYADFKYEEHSATGWTVVYEDSKGMDTPLSKWKRKHVKAQYGIEVKLT